MFILRRLDKLACLGLQQMVNTQANLKCSVIIFNLTIAIGQGFLELKFCNFIMAIFMQNHIHLSFLSLQITN